MSESDSSSALATSAWVQALLSSQSSGFLTASAYTRGGSTSISLPSATAAVGTVGSSGWSRDPSGLIRQWAYIQLVSTMTGETVTTWTYPIAFPAGPLKFRATCCVVAAGQGGGNTSNATAVLAGTPSATSADWTVHNTGATGNKACFLLEVDGY